MMGKDEVDRFARQRPFEPFEIRLVDGQRFRLKSIEEFVVGRYAVGILMKDGTIAQVGIGLISTIRPISARLRGRSHSRFGVAKARRRKRA